MKSDTPNDTPKSQKVGLVGLGAMGRGMAGSLRRAGADLHVFDVRSEAAEAFAKEGGTVCASLAELGARCDVVVSVVVNAAQTESVLFGDGGCAATMKPGGVFVMCSTVDPNWSASLETRLAAMGLTKEDPVILICRSGVRSNSATGLLTHFGFKRAYTVIDGFEGDKGTEGASKGYRTVNGWKNAKLPWSYKLDTKKMYIDPL